MGDYIVSRSGTEFPPARRELTSDEIFDRYGTLMDLAFSAFREDPDYLVAMAENASLIAYKRVLWTLRMEATRNITERHGDRGTTEQVREETARLMAERGVATPSKAPRRRRSRATA